MNIPVGLKGTFKLKDPISNLTNENTVYEVLGVRSIKELLDDNIDVVNIVFVSIGLTEADYEQCLIDNTTIVSLKSEGDIHRYIPSSYIERVPTYQGPVMVNQGLLVDLKYLPEDLDIDYVNVEVKALVDSLLGCDSQVIAEQISGSYIISYDDYDTHETARLAGISRKTTWKGLYESSMETVALYKTKVAALVKKLENCCP